LRRAGRLHDAGVDLVAHCANDLLTTGAEPLFFLDYAAAGTLDLAEVAELVAGAASVCRAVGCAILGGETAELPGVYRAGELDFAGTMVGLVRRDRLVDGSRCEPGDAVLGLPSSGLHANGFTLVRRLLGDDDFDPDLLLPPTRLYLEDVRGLRARCDVRALAHVTGGGIPGNLPRALPDGLGAVVDPAAWERPPVYAWLDEQGVPEEEQRRVFNLGVGYCAVVPGGEAERAGFPVIGRLEAGSEGVRWVER
jgi:phosphoribosylformylglycinamidine cyclo-ligase